jgi:hypothetical protein
LVRNGKEKLSERVPEIQSARASAHTDTVATAMYDVVIKERRKSNNLATVSQDGQLRNSMQFRGLRADMAWTMVYWPVMVSARQAVAYNVFNSEVFRSAAGSYRSNVLEHVC